MNTVKYRAWMPKEKKWYKGGAIQLTALQGNTFGLSEANGKIVQLQQWTGLTDRLGVEIYEGDVIEAFELRYVVEWCQNLDNYDYHILTPLIGFAFRPLQEEQSHKDFKSVYFGERFEVIGNIYENPELLGGKDGEN